MSRKTKESYKKLFGKIKHIAQQNSIVIEPKFIISDFELAVIKATSEIFAPTVNKTCFFHFSQNIWRKVQSLSLSKLYGENTEFSLKIRHLTALAFLTPQEIPGAFAMLRKIMPEDAKELIEWFDDFYVNGKEKRRYGRKIRSNPLFPQEIWSVEENNREQIPRTSNQIEAWHRRFESIVTVRSPSLFVIVDEFRKEQKQYRRLDAKHSIGRTKKTKNKKTNWTLYNE